jgi:hypothetical protein
VVIDEETLECWRINYELHRDPHDLADFWRAGPGVGPVLALKAAVEEIERLNGQLAEARELLKRIRDRDNSELDESWYSSPLPHYLRDDIDTLLGKDSE